MTVIDAQRTENPQLLLLDCGGVIPRYGKDIDLKAEVALITMNMVNYDAINLGASELRFGPDFLERKGKELSLPFLSSNLKISNNTPPWAKEYIIKKVDGVRVAILGVMPSDALRKTGDPTMSTTDISVLSPETALADLIPKVSREADYIVLLSQLPYTETKNLLKGFEKIDLAIACDKRPPGPREDPPTVVEGHTSGLEIGKLRLVKNENSGKLSAAGPDMLPMKNQVLKDMRVMNLISERFSERFKEERALREQKRSEKMHEKLRQGLDQSPEEFFKQNPDKITDPEQLDQYRKTFEKSKTQKGQGNYELIVVPDCKDDNTNSGKE